MQATAEIWTVKAMNQPKYFEIRTLMMSFFCK